MHWDGEGLKGLVRSKSDIHSENIYINANRCIGMTKGWKDSSGQKVTYILKIYILMLIDALE